MTIKEKRELDSWIAENVFGWTDCRGEFGTLIRYAGTESEQAIEISIPEYTTSSVDAMDVLKRCVDVCLNEVEISHLCNSWEIRARRSHKPSDFFKAHADSLELAICLFAKRIF